VANQVLYPPACRHRYDFEPPLNTLVVPSPTVTNIVGWIGIAFTSSITAASPAEPRQAGIIRLPGAAARKEPSTCSAAQLCEAIHRQRSDSSSSLSAGKLGPGAATVQADIKSNPYEFET
jgi:hypothetical protein